MRFLSPVTGRKGAAFDKALFVLLVLATMSATDGFSDRDLDAVLYALVALVVAFCGGNVGEHFAKMREDP